MRNTTDFRWAWAGALACFVLAGLTGAFFRFGVFHGYAGLNPINIRHAHSHLMFFGWVTPALMALIAARLPQAAGRKPSQGMHVAIAATLVLGLLAYTPFLLYGYGVAHIGARRLPLSVIGSGLNIIGWYGFALAYWRTTRGAPRTLSLRLWDAALMMLGIATLGAWGLGLLQGAATMAPFPAAAALHLFLNLFSEGWFVLAALGVLHAAHPSADGRLARIGTDLAAYALPFTFLLGVTVALVPPHLRAFSGAAGVMVSVGLLLHVRALWPVARAGVRVPLAFLALRAVAQVFVGVAPVARWGEAAGLRVSYLHWLLLGFVSLTLVAAARSVWGAAAVRGQTVFVGGALAIIASLVPLTGLWPVALYGTWVWRAAAWTALVPSAGALCMLGGMVAGCRAVPSVSDAPCRSSHRPRELPEAPVL